MSSLPLDDKVKQLFDEVTNGRSSEEPPRAILVQNDNGMIRYINSAAAEGSDRDDFNGVLGKLFSAEPNKPGYALYRLDSKSPAGLYEWINCAFRPEGAKVREKMQYSITQASLFKGLNEQHFLETVYGATVNEFSFPSRLRNSRKHDYQNPQLSTKGKSAADAAGTDAGGKRRNFDAVANEPALTSASAPTKLVATMPEVANNVQAEPKPAESTQPAAEKQEITTPSTKQFSEPIKNKEPSKEEAVEPSSKEVASLPSEPNPQEKIEKDVTPVEVEKESLKDEPVKEESKSTVEAKKEEEIPLAKESAATSLPEPVRQTTTKNVPEPQKEEIPAATPKAVQEEEKKEVITTPTATQATSSVGLGRGAEGLETEKEKELAKLKSEEMQTRASEGTGGPKTGFAWESDVEGALQQLSKGSNLVALRLDLTKEEVQVAGKPESVEPSGLISSISGSTDEPKYVLYAHPALQSDKHQERQLALIYVCPTNSTVRQRMLYSVNLAIMSNRVNEIQGIKIVKRTETSDVEDLTPDFLEDALSLNGSNGAQQNGQNAFTRPKRPGRR